MSIDRLSRTYGMIHHPIISGELKVGISQRVVLNVELQPNKTTVSRLET